MVNGSLTWGGYDRGRFVDDVSTYDMDLTNQDVLPISVKDIIIATADKTTSTSLFDSSRFANTTSISSFTGRLSTDQYPISLPYQLTQNFKNLLPTEPSNLSDGSLALSTPFDGTMAIVLSNGFRITIPSDVLSNNSITPIRDREPNDTSPSYLGLSFLSQLYLMLDYEASKFHLATAVQQNAYVMPTPFCASVTPEAYVAPHRSSFERNGLIGVIIGVVIAGIAFVATSFFVWKACMDHRKQVKDEKQERMAAKALKLQTQYTGFQHMEEGMEYEREHTPLMARMRFWR